MRYTAFVKVVSTQHEYNHASQNGFIRRNGPSYGIDDRSHGTRNGVRAMTKTYTPPNVWKWEGQKQGRFASTNP
jgi:hypothetical protein